MNIKIVDRRGYQEEYKQVKAFFIEYQKHNGKTWWLFLRFENGKNLAVEILPNFEHIQTF